MKNYHARGTNVKRANNEVEIFVSPHGEDSWSGRLPEPDLEKNDGPVATIAKAKEIVRRARINEMESGHITVWIRGGRYFLDEPIRFTAEDSGPVSYRAYPGEEPIFDGGLRVENWKKTEVNGKECWSSDVSEIMARWGSFNSLFVNGVRRQRPRLPKKGFFYPERVPGHPQKKEFPLGTDRFISRSGDIPDDLKIADAEIVLFHKWVEERMPIKSYNAETGLVISSRITVQVVIANEKNNMSRYYIDNLFSSLTEPGEWFLDREAELLYYIPEKGETPENTEVNVPVLYQFLRLEGNPENRKYIENVRFEGLTFRHTDWKQPDSSFRRFDPYRMPEDWRERHSLFQSNGLTRDKAPGLLAGYHQASLNIPGVVHFTGAVQCSVEECTIEHVGFYCIELADGCRNNRITGNIMRDMGAGGLNVDGANYPSPPCLFTGNNCIGDNEIVAGGRIFASACGILLAHSYGNLVTYNSVHDLYYTGISSGWQWDRSHHVSRDNIIENNHIYDIGQGMLADMGGIYILGVQPGTRVRRNLIHDVKNVEYGGNGIYTDAATANVVVEENIVYNAGTHCVLNNAQNSENIYRNNIFAFGGDGVIRVTRSGNQYPDDGGFDRAATFMRNIIITDGVPVFTTNWWYWKDKPKTQNLFISECNLFWDVSGKTPVMVGDPAAKGRTIDLKDWVSYGCDMFSIVADPKFKDVKGRDFRFLPGSPALKIGFKHIDLSEVGPREKDRRNYTRTFNSGYR